MRMPFVLAAAAMLVAPLPAFASDWYRVTRGQSATWYIDVDSIQRSGQWTRVRQYSIYDEVSTRTGVKSAWSDVEFDCGARTVRYARFTSMGPDGAEKSSFDWPDQGKVHPITPGTVLGTLANFTCAGDRNGAVRIADPRTDVAPR